MSKTGTGRKRKGSGDQPPDSGTRDSGGPEEAAAFIAEAAGELSRIADRHSLKTLKYLLDMTQLEAEEWQRNRRKLS